LQATAEALTKFLLPFKLGNFVTTWGKFIFTHWLVSNGYSEW
jgi:hypothetical protein